MLDRVTGGGPRVDHASENPANRSRGNGDPSRNPWTMRPRAASGAFAAGQALPAPRARQTRSPRRRLTPRARALGLGPLAAHKLETAGVLILMTGLAVTGALFLAPGHRAAAPRRSLLAATAQFAASDARSVATQKRAMFFTVERVAAERQAAQRRARARAAGRRKARARAGARRQARIKAQQARQRAQTIYASAATPATSTGTSAGPVASTAADLAVSGSAAASETSSAQDTQATSEPTITSTSPSSSSSSNSTNQSTSGSKQPAFGSAGTLGPGSSPDG